MASTSIHRAVCCDWPFLLPRLPSHPTNLYCICSLRNVTIPWLFMSGQIMTMILYKHMHIFSHTQSLDVFGACGWDKRKTPRAFNPDVLGDTHTRFNFDTNFNCIRECVGMVTFVRPQSVGQLLEWITWKIETSRSRGKYAFSVRLCAGQQEVAHGQIEPDPTTLFYATKKRIVP